MIIATLFIGLLLVILVCFLCYGLGFKKGSEEQHKTDLEAFHKEFSEYHNDILKIIKSPNTEKDPYDDDYEPVI